MILQLYNKPYVPLPPSLAQSLYSTKTIKQYNGYHLPWIPYIMSFREKSHKLHMQFLKHIHICFIRTVFHIYWTFHMQCILKHCATGNKLTTSHLQGPRFNPDLFTCSPCVCMGVIQVFWFPPASLW